MRLTQLLVSLLIIATPAASYSQQRADDQADVSVAAPWFQRGQGPVVLIDEGHTNFHTLDGRYAPFARVLANDGFQVRAHQGPLTRESLAGARVLVIANALNPRNAEDWSLPTPDAFSDDEIIVLRSWVEDGGSLWLMADHMPFPGAVERLGAAFGVTFSNGFVVPTHGEPSGPDLFSRDAGTLGDHEITRGFRAGERIDQVGTFTGSGFQAADAAPLLRFPDGAYQSLEPSEAWQFSEATPTRQMDGWFQGAAMQVGRGRVAVFGEAAMFTAQRTNRGLMGFTSPEAPQNKQFLLNVAHWLAGADASGEE